jgi:hypothetical protein
MKYLKLYEKFNNISELKQLISDSLLYLTDDGFTLQFGVVNKDVVKNETIYSIWITASEIDDNYTDSFQLKDIKDDLVRLLLILSDNGYSIYKINYSYNYENGFVGGGEKSEHLIDPSDAEMGIGNIENILNRQQYLELIELEVFIKL